MHILGNKMNNEKFNIDKLNLIILAYDLPFALDLKDCLSVEHTGENFSIVLNGIPGQLRTERVYKEPSLNYNIGPFPEIKIGSDSKIDNDRYGFLSYTKIQIWFDSRAFDTLGIERKHLMSSADKLFDLSLKYLNKFLMDYRSSTREYWIRPVKKRDILSSVCIWQDSDEKDERCFSGIHADISFNKDMSIPQDQENILRKLIASAEDDLADSLLLSAYDNLDLGNYNNTIIQCAILFEHFIYTSLDGKLSKKKLKKIQRKVDCNCFVGVYQICTTGLKQEFGLDFGDSEEFINFHKKVLKIRNDLVHGAKLQNVEYQDANEAIAVTLIAIDKLHSELK